jgi:hypothetical protein
MKAFASLDMYIERYLGSWIERDRLAGEGGGVTHLEAWLSGENPNPGVFLLRAPMTFYSLNKSFLPLFR